MPAITVKVYLGTQILYNTQVLMDLEEPVGALKKKICEKLSRLSDNQELQVEVVFNGGIMQDCIPIRKYGIVQGDTVHIFKNIQTQMPSPATCITKTNMDDLLAVALSFKKNAAFRNSMINHTNPDEIFNIILNVPGMKGNLVSIAHLPLSELLLKLMDNSVLLDLALHHPGLAFNILHLATVALKGLLRATQYEELFKEFMEGCSNEDITDIDDSSTASVSRNSSFSHTRIKTVSQLTSALTRLNIQQPQQITSGSSTSTTNSIKSPGYLMDSEKLSTSLQMMREMGLSDENLNIYTLKQTNDLEIAVELIFNGFDIGDNFKD